MPTTTLRTLRTNKGLVVETEMSDADAVELLKTVKNDFGQTLVKKYGQYGFLTNDQLAWAHAIVIKAGLGAGKVDDPNAKDGQGGGRKFYRKGGYSRGSKETRGQTLPDFVKVNLDNVLGLFQFVRERGRPGLTPGVHLTMGDGGRPVVIQMAGPKSRCPGTLNVTDDRKYPDNSWYGRIYPSGMFEMSVASDGDIFDFLKSLAADAAKMIETKEAVVVGAR